MPSSAPIRPSLKKTFQLYLAFNKQGSLHELPFPHPSAPRRHPGMGSLAVLWETPRSMFHLENFCGWFTQNPAVLTPSSPFHSKSAVPHCLLIQVCLFQNQRRCISIAIMIRRVGNIYWGLSSVSCSYKHFMCIISFNPPNQRRKKYCFVTGASRSHIACRPHRLEQNQDSPQPPQLPA